MRTLLGRDFGRAALVFAAAFTAAFSPNLSHADDIKLIDLSPSETTSIIRELSANFAYSSQTPASGLGGVWGFELGLLGGITKMPAIRDVVRARADANFKQDMLPHAGALVRVGAPFGLTAEAVILPKIKASTAELSQYSGAVMWTMTDAIWKNLPVNLAVKGFVSKTDFGFRQRVKDANSGVEVDGRVGYDNTSFGGQFLVSKKLSVFEPYVGIGYAKANGELSVKTDDINYNGTIFTTGGQSAAAKPTSSQLLAGLDIRLFFIALGAEYQRSFGTDSVSGRVSFRF